MKRFIMGAGWCMVLWMGSMILGGFVVGAIAGATAGDPTTTVQAGHNAGAAFGAKYGNLALLGSIVVSAIGTILGGYRGRRARRLPLTPPNYRLGCNTERGKAAVFAA